MAVLHEERVATLDAAVREQDPLGAGVGDLDVGGDRVRAVDDIDGSVARYDLRPRVVHVGFARRRDLGPLVGEPLLATAVDGQDVVTARVDVPQADHLDQLVAVLPGHVARLGRVLGQGYWVGASASSKTWG